MMKTQELQKKIKLEFMLWSSFLHEINSELILRYYVCNYQMFSYVLKNNFLNIFFRVKL